MDYLCTTPPELLNTIENVLTLYDTSRSRATMAGDAASLMNPEERGERGCKDAQLLAFRASGLLCLIKHNWVFSMCVQGCVFDVVWFLLVQVIERLRALQRQIRRQFT